LAPWSCLGLVRGLLRRDISEQSNRHKYMFLNALLDGCMPRSISTLTPRVLLSLSYICLMICLGGSLK
jgi:hypothetical protein